MISINPIQTILKEEGIFFRDQGKNISRSGNWVGVDCPFCVKRLFTADKGQHLGINLNSMSVSCFRCGYRGKLISFFREVVGDAGAKLLLQKIPKFYEMSEISLPERKNSLSVDHFNRALTEREKAFLSEKRKFNPQELQMKYHVRGGGFQGNNPMDLRVVIPYFYNGRVVTYSGMAVAGQQPKYLHLKADMSILTPKETLYNVDACGNVVLIVEGVTDVWRIGDGAVAASNTTLSATQLLMLIKKNPKVVYVMLDRDAWSKSEDMGNLLTTYFTEVYRIPIPEGFNDPGEFDPDTVRKLRSELF